MLQNFPVMTQIAITDIDKAVEFYEGKLGLKADQMPFPDMRIYKCGNGTSFLIYQRSIAGHAENTVMSFEVKDIENVVEKLKEKGVVFEEYDMPELKTENSIAAKGKVKSAWFKDPDENIIGLIEVSK